MGAWWADQLAPAHRDYMRSFEHLIELPLEDDGALVAFHGSPRSFDDYIYATTPDDELNRMLGDVRAPLLAGGHTHFQMVRRHEEALLLNPGSVGLPFRHDGAVMPIAPWAEYGLVTVESGRLGVELRRASFDVGALCRLIASSGMPHAEWWAGLWRTEQSPVPAAEDC